MDNYKVKAIINFDDVEAGVHREANKSIFTCSAERYAYLKEHNAVELIEVIPMPIGNKDEENVVALDEKNTKKVAKDIEKHISTKKKNKK